MIDQCRQVFKNAPDFRWCFKIKANKLKGALVIGGLLGTCASAQSSGVIRLAFDISDQSDPADHWEHLESFHKSALADIEYVLRKEFKPLDRVALTNQNGDRVVDMPWRQTRETDGATFTLQLRLRRFSKLFRNRGMYQTRDELSQMAREPIMHEMIALPVLSGAIEAHLISEKSHKTIWSTLHDSSIMLAHNGRFIYNLEKYPGYAPPELIRDYAVPILRQRSRRPSALRMLSAADRWYISSADEDLISANAMLRRMVADLVPEIDANLPLSGSIVSQVGLDEKQRPMFQLDLGSDVGIRNKMRLEVLRSGKSGSKIGQIEIVSVDSASSVGRVRKLERSVRKRGGTIDVGDQVISRQRPPKDVKKD